MALLGVDLVEVGTLVCAGRGIRIPLLGSISGPRISPAPDENDGEGRLNMILTLRVKD